jgi:hypothetical protein
MTSVFQLHIPLIAGIRAITMVNVQNFDAKIYQHAIKWQKVMRLI